MSFNIHNPSDTSRIKWDRNVASRLSVVLDKKQAFVDSECLRLMSPLTPFRTGALRDSASIHTVIGSGEIKQQTPYARRQYYEHKSKSRWFDTMKNRHRDQILKGAEKI